MKIKENLGLKTSAAAEGRVSPKDANLQLRALQRKFPLPRTRARALTQNRKKILRTALSKTSMLPSNKMQIFPRTTDKKSLKVGSRLIRTRLATTGREDRDLQTPKTLVQAV